MYLTDLLNRIDIIHAWAEHIHLGVYYKHIDAGPGGREVEKDAISESAILLSSMVDAFGAIFGLLVEAVGDVMGDPKQEQCGKKAVKAFNEAQSKLETARDELIVEASGVAAGEHIGPVVTPEAILILHMERLVCGVYRAGNVDIISILEECLERLVSLRFMTASEAELMTATGSKGQVSLQSSTPTNDQRFRRGSCRCA